MDQLDIIFRTLGTPSREMYPRMSELPNYSVRAMRGSPPFSHVIDSLCCWLHSAYYNARVPTSQVTCGSSPDADRRWR